MTANFFSNKDPNLPDFCNLKLPRIKSALPNIKMQGDSELLFEIDGKNILMSDVAEKFGSIYFNS